MAIRTPILPCVSSGPKPSGHKPRVWNKYHKNAPPDAVYIGRGSPWGNPYVIGKDGDRDEVIARYERNLTDHDRLLIKSALKGRHLLCFCAPRHCHGDVLLRIANSED